MACEIKDHFCYRRDTLLRERMDTVVVPELRDNNAYWRTSGTHEKLHALFEARTWPSDFCPFNEAMTSDGRCVYFLLREYGCSHIMQPFRSNRFWFYKHPAAVYYSAKADNMEAFLFAFDNMQMHSFLSDEKSLQLICHVSEIDQPDSRYTLMLLERMHKAPVPDYRLLQESFEVSENLTRALLLMGVPKPWRSWDHFVIHNPLIKCRPKYTRVKRSACWEAYTKTCADWTPERHRVFPRFQRNAIRTVFTLALAKPVPGKRELQLVSPLAMLPREVLYRVIEIMTGMVY